MESLRRIAEMAAGMIVGLVILYNATSLFSRAAPKERDYAAERSFAKSCINRGGSLLEDVESPPTCHGAKEVQ